MAWSEKAFKAYDIRGVYDTDIDEELAFLLGKALGKYVDLHYGPMGKLLRGCDTRPENEWLIEYFLAGMQAVGNTRFYGVAYNPEVPHPNPAQRGEYGCCSTSMMYYFGRGYDLTVIFSASHNPAGHVGFKITNSEWLFLGTEMLRQMVMDEHRDDIPAELLELQFPEDDYLTDISARKQALFVKLDEKFSTLAKKHHFGVDYSNGAGVGFEYQYFVHHLSNDHRIHHLNEYPDGTFPVHGSDTIKYSNYEGLLKKLKGENAEFGIMFDGDADRVGFLTPKGKVVNGDIMTAIIAKQLLNEDHPKKSKIVMYDLTCSKIVPQTISENGGIPVATPVGRAKIATMLSEQNGLFAGEMSSHFMFGTFGNHEMTLLALYYVLKELENHSDFDAMVEAYTWGYRGELVNFLVSDKSAAISKLKHTYADYPQWDLDGITIEGEEWRFNVRASNTENKLRLNLEATTKEIYEMQLSKISDIIA